MKTFYGYQLTLAFYEKGESIKDYSTGKAVDLVAVFSNYLDTDLSYKKESGSSQLVVALGRMNLSSLSYQKQLYKPNSMRASIECDTGLKTSMLLLADLFKEARAKLEVVCYNENEDSSGNRSISKESDVKPKTIVNNYEVYESSPRYDKSQKKMYIDLVMYSPDKVLDTFEYSKAYTNQRLGLDIFKTEADAIALKKLGLECENMQILRLSKDEEFIQPYLVQYNETFYSFLSRVANRCGEFLYYDDTTGKLSLGIKPVTEVEVTYEGGKKGKEKQYDFQDSDFDKISFTDFNTSHNRDTDSEDFYNNYMVAGGSSPSKSYVRNSELSGNEYYETVNKDGFSSAKYERELNSWGLYPTIGVLFTHYLGSGLFLAAVTAGKEHLWDVNQRTDAVNEHFNNKFFSGSDNSTSKLLFGSADKMVSAISTGEINVNSSFFTLVRDKEVSLGRNRVSLQISSNITKVVNLGDRINFFGKEYVVIDVDASFGVVVNSNGSTAIRQPINVVAIPVDTVPMPTCSVNPIRKVGCQRAFVTDVDDPSFLGRVRVRFCWQKTDADSSPWIRVCCQMANSKGGAAYFKAAVGDSVLIDFENGNVDMPYVAGFLPTIDQQKNKGQYLSRRQSVVISSENGQMMLMSDPEKGNSMVFPDVLPSLTPFIPMAPSYDAKKTRMLGSTEFTDHYGTYSLKMSSTDRAISIRSPFGTVGIDAFTGVSINAPNGDIRIEGKNITLSAGNNVTIESGVNARAGSFRRTSDLILGAAADFVADTLVPMVIDLGYLRNVIEIFLRPCEGTLSLNSGRFLMIQAGGAAAKLPRTGFVIPQGTTENAERKMIADLLNVLNFIDGIVNALEYNYDLIRDSYKEAYDTWTDTFIYGSDDRANYVIEGFDFDSLMQKVNEDANGDLDPFNVGNFDFTVGYISYVKTWKRSKFVGGIKFVHNKLLGRIDKFKADENILRGPTKEELVKTANRMVSKLRNVRLSTGFRFIKDNMEIWRIASPADPVNRAVSLMGNAKLGEYENVIKNGLKDIIQDPHRLPGQTKYNKRSLSKDALQFAQSTKHIFGMKEVEPPENINDDKQWENYIKALFDGQEIGKGEHFKQSLLDAGKSLFDKINPFQQKSGKAIQGWRKWKPEQRGRILMSDTEGTTMYFSNGTLKSFSNSDLYAVKSFCEKRL